MAKRTTATMVDDIGGDDNANDLATIFDIPLSIDVGGESYTITDPDTLPHDSLRYLLANGFSQAIRDAGAVEATRKLPRAFADEHGLGKDATFADLTDEQRDAYRATLRAAKLKAIEDGTVNIRNVTRLPTIERVMADIAAEEIAATAKARKLTITQKRIGELVPGFVAKHTDRLRTAAQARLDEAASRADDFGDDLDELLAASNADGEADETAADETANADADATA